MRRSSKRFKRNHKVFLFIVPILLCILSVTTPAEGVLLVLSDYASNGPPPEVVDLYATLEFTIEGGDLVLTVDNRTDENISGNQYSIAEIFFNAPDTLADIPSSGQGQGSRRRFGANRP